MQKIGAIVLAGMSLFALAAAAADVTVVFTNVVGEVNPKIHSSGWGPRIYPRAIRRDEPDLKPLNLYAARTHDWALVNQGQRVVDTHFIFPLMHLDAKDPKNYYFKPTDDLLNLSRQMGLKLFYRLGTSIEHTAERHYNILPPEDNEKYAEVLAGIMRHYLKGWADGFRWADDFDGWEIWNEPDGISNCWGGNGKGGKELRGEFVRFFVTVLRRLKAEFPDQQIGGPALCSANKEYFTELLTACKAAGVAPDFVSWHCYSQNGFAAAGSAHEMRKLLDELGFPRTRLILNEWHYIRTWDGIHGKDSTPEAIRRAHEGPTGHLNVDSAAFSLRTLIGFQNSPIDEAFYYGSGASGNWGYFTRYGEYNKCWYSMKMFGDFVRRTKSRVAVRMPKHVAQTVGALAGFSADGKTASLLVVDYRGKEPGLKVDLAGLPPPKAVEALVLDHTRDLAPVSLAVDKGLLTLPRADANSYAYLLTFEL